jgi:hypothetical protein
MKRFLLVAVAALLAVITAGGAGGASASHATAVRPRLLLAVQYPIIAFAQDSNSLAWVGTGYNVHIRSLVTRRTATVGSAMPNANPRWVPTLALAGTRALWTRWGGGNSVETGLWTSSLGTRPTLIDLFTGGMEFPGGVFLGGLAGDGPTLIYGRTPERCENPNDPTTCSSLTVDGGGVVLVTGQYLQPAIDGIPAPALLAFAGHDPQSGAISQGLVAVAPAQTTLLSNLYRGVPRVAANGPVQVYRLLNRPIMTASVAPKGTVKALALSFSQLAVLLQRADGTLAVERYNPLSGNLIGVVAVPKATAPALGTGSAGTVFHVGRRIYLLAGQHAKLVWTAQVTPIGLSIEGRRIAWASSTHIMALTIPR